MGKTILMDNSKIFRLVVFVFCLVFIFCATGCVEIFQKIKVNRDGSGTAYSDFHVLKEIYPMVAAELKKDIPKGWSIVSEKDEGEKHVVSMKANFRNLSELSDEHMTYTFSSTKQNLFQDLYSINIRLFPTGEANPIQIQIILELPGTINYTNGEKISSNKVKWTFSGSPKEKMMIVQSSAFGIEVYWGLGIIGILLLGGILFIMVIKRKGNLTQPTHGSRKIFCTQCGKENDSNSVFCVHCGQRI